MRVHQTSQLLKLSKEKVVLLQLLVVDQELANNPKPKLTADLKLDPDQDPQTVVTMLETVLLTTFLEVQLSLNNNNSNNKKAALPP
jgi:hypothetical protein